MRDGKQKPESKEASVKILDFFAEFLLLGIRPDSEVGDLAIF
jgi:hypothetical protein